MTLKQKKTETEKCKNCGTTFNVWVYVSSSKTWYKRKIFCSRWCNLVYANANAVHLYNRGITLTAFGETKSFAAWAHDKRCNVELGTLRSRIEKLGWIPEEALTTPSERVSLQKYKQYQLFKQAVLGGLSEIISSERYEPEITTPPPRKSTRYHLLTVFGETKSVTEWARDPRCKITYASFKKRIWNGWTPEEAITSPPMQGKKTRIKSV